MTIRRKKESEQALDKKSIHPIHIQTSHNRLALTSACQAEGAVHRAQVVKSISQSAGLRCLA